MVDPLSIAASCAGITSAIISMTVRIAQFSSDVRDSRKDLDAVRRELSSLELSLSALSSEEEEFDFQIVPSLKANLFKVLDECRDKIVEMGVLFDEMEGAKLVKRAKWAATGKTKLLGLKSSLESHKMSLEIALDLIGVLITANIKRDTTQILAQNDAIKDDTGHTRLAVDEILEGVNAIRLARSGTIDHNSGIVMERFIAESIADMESPYAGSLASSEDEKEIEAATDKTAEKLPAIAKPALATTTREHFLDGDLLEGDDDDDDDDDWPGELGNSFNLLHHSPKIEEGPSHMIIAIEYGVKFSGLAFAITSSDKAILEEIDVVNDWGRAMNCVSKVPSIISYSPPTALGESQWGYDISDNAIVMENTKLDLDFQSKFTRSDELTLIYQMLNGGILDFNCIQRWPQEFPIICPEQIVTDFLTKLFSRYEEIIFDRYNRHFLESLLVSIVVTVPADWSHRGGTSLLQAVDKAGFNKQIFPRLQDIILLSESDADAVYTTRNLLTRDKQLLKEGDCFVLCKSDEDYVEVLAYKVKRVEPNFELESLIPPISAKCGPTSIEESFIKWIRIVLGDKIFMRLNPGYFRGLSLRRTKYQTKAMRKLTEDFKNRASCFRKGKQGIMLELPNPMDDLTHGTRVKQGLLIINEFTLHKPLFGGLLLTSYSEDMASIFESCLDVVTESILTQLEKGVKMNQRVEKILFTGPLAEVHYVREQLMESMNLRRLSLVVSDKMQSYTSVLQGAVIYGVEKCHHENLAVATKYPRNIGVVFNPQHWKLKPECEQGKFLSATGAVSGRVIWLIQKDDFLISDHPMKTRTDLDFCLRRGTSPQYVMMPSFIKINILESTNEANKLPNSSRISYEKLNELSTVSYNPCTDPYLGFRKFEKSIFATGHVVHCGCIAEISDESLTVSMTWNGKIMLDNKKIITPTAINSNDILISLNVSESYQDLWVATEPLKTKEPSLSVAQLWKLREQIRIKYQLDVEIWFLRNATGEDRKMVEKKMEAADEIMLNITAQVQAWDQKGWDLNEWSIASEVREMLLAPGKRVWRDNPPWNDTA